MVLRRYLADHLFTTKVLGQQFIIMLCECVCVCNCFFSFAAFHFICAENMHTETIFAKKKKRLCHEIPAFWVFICAFSFGYKNSQHVRNSYHLLFVVRGNNAKNRTQHTTEGLESHIHTHTCIHGSRISVKHLSVLDSIFINAIVRLCAKRIFRYIYNKCRVCTTSAIHEHSTLTSDRHNITFARIYFFFFFLDVVRWFCCCGCSPFKFNWFEPICFWVGHFVWITNMIFLRVFCELCLHAFFFLWFNFLLRRSSFFRAHFGSTLLWWIKYGIVILAY